MVGTARGGSLTAPVVSAAFSRGTKESKFQFDREAFEEEEVEEDVAMG